MPESLTTASDVIDALDGTTAVARITGRKPQHVTNWRASGRLPPATFLILSDALKGRGKAAPSSLWGIDEPNAPPTSPETAEPEQVQP
jgi:hypothetical protein